MKQQRQEMFNIQGIHQKLFYHWTSVAQVKWLCVST